jgi:hypothetical protein
MPASPIRLLFPLLVAAAIGMPIASRSQGGPPLVTDDPDTPPDGHWEINLAAIGVRFTGEEQLSLPDADINYGWGDHVQLKFDTPWLLSRADGEPAKSGLGATNLGVKWRFVDADRSGFSMSTYPQVLINTLPSSYRRGLTAPGQTWLLPVELSTQRGGFAFDGELGRYVSTSLLARLEQPDAWVAGFIVSRDCAPRLECLAEIRQAFASGDAQTLLNIGGHRQLSESLSLLFAAGHEFGPARPDHEQLLFYVGLQVLR